MKLTGGQIVAKALKEYGVQYVAGVPGHGIWSLFDAFLEAGSDIPFIQVMHEQSAVHMADGYYRACGKPMACSTSVGPGAANTITSGTGTPLDVESTTCDVTSTSDVHRFMVDYLVGDAAAPVTARAINVCCGLGNY